MALRSLRTVLALYRGGTLTLEEATEETGLQRSRLEAELRSRGIQVREASTQASDTAPNA